MEHEVVDIPPAQVGFQVQLCVDNGSTLVTVTRQDDGNYTVRFN